MVRDLKKKKVIEKPRVLVNANGLSDSVYI